MVTPRWTASFPFSTRLAEGAKLLACSSMFFLAISASSASTFHVNNTHCSQAKRGDGRLTGVDVASDRERLGSNDVPFGLALLANDQRREHVVVQVLFGHEVGQAELLVGGDFGEVDISVVGEVGGGHFAGQVLLADDSGANSGKVLWKKFRSPC